MNDDLTLLIDAAKAAAPLAMRHWRADPEVWEKPDGAGPVSKADLEVDEALRQQLRAARPGYGWLSEESDDDGSRLNCSRTFIVDPIDGTRAFLAGETSWALSLAVACNGLVEAGVIYLPAKDRVYAAARGAGAHLNNQVIMASNRTQLDEANILAARPMLQPELWPGGVPPICRKFRPSLAYRMALVAEGRYDGMLTLRPSWEWDIAAGSLIASEAGAMVSDPAGAAPRFNNPTPKLPGIVAAPAPLHREFITRLTA